MSKECFAAIDLGTNSCRLLIADDCGVQLYSDAAATKLGEGMYEQMKFTDAAIERGLKDFGKCREAMDKFGVTRYRAIATASCRMASNGTEFVGMVKKQCGIEIEVVDGEEEARLNLKGAMQHVRGKSKYVVVYDLGGGSTEITLATNEDSPKILYTVSIPWGARNSAEAFELVEYIPSRVQKLVEEISAYCDVFVKETNLKEKLDKTAFVSTSSTPLRLISMVKKTDGFDREKADGLKASVAEFDAAIASIFQMSRIEMAMNPYIGNQRSFIFVAACVIFKTIYDKLEVPELTASLKSAKDGIIEELVKEYGKVNKVG